MPNPEDDSAEYEPKVLEHVRLLLESTELGEVLMEISKFEKVPRVCLLVTHGFVEVMVNALIDESLKNAKKITDDNRTYPHSAKLVMLNEVGLISDHWFRLLDWLRKLRNKAAHEPVFRLTADDLHLFVKDEHRDPTQFSSLCFS